MITFHKVLQTLKVADYLLCNASRQPQNDILGKLTKFMQVFVGENVKLSVTCMALLGGYSL